MKNEYVKNLLYTRKGKMIADIGDTDGIRYKRMKTSAIKRDQEECDQDGQDKGKEFCEIYVTYRDSASCSVLQRCKSIYPLRIMQNHTWQTIVSLTLLGYGGGLVDGDDIRLRIELGSDATTM